MCSLYPVVIIILIWWGRVPLRCPNPTRWSSKETTLRVFVLELQFTRQLCSVMGFSPIVADDKGWVYTPFVTSRSSSSCILPVCNQNFPVDVGGSSKYTNLVYASEILSSQFFKQRPYRKMTGDRTSLTESIRRHFKRD